MERCFFFCYFMSTSVMYFIFKTKNVNRWMFWVDKRLVCWLLFLWICVCQKTAVNKYDYQRASRESERRSKFEPAKNISHHFKYLLCLEVFDHFISLFVTPLTLADSPSKSHSALSFLFITTQEPLPSHFCIILGVHRFKMWAGFARHWFINGKKKIFIG